MQYSSHAKMNCELAQNPVFQALVNVHKDIYHQASSNNWTVCIPNSGFPLKVKRNFILFHVLKPSPLLIQHFLTLQKSNIDVEINKDRVILTRPKQVDSEEIAILSEEFAYTQDNKKVSVLIIEKPLIKVKPVDGKVYFADEFSQQTTTIKTFEDSILHLRKKSSKALQELYLNSLKFDSSCIASEDDLGVARTALEAIINEGIKKFSHSGSTYQVKCLDTFIATETFVVAVNYEPIFKKMLSIFSRDERVLLESLEKVGNASITDLGAQNHFSSFAVPESVKEQFHQLNEKTSPLEKLHCFKAIFDNINTALKNIPGPPINPLEKIHPEKIAIISDDILAATIFCLINTKPRNILSHVKFVSYFNWRLPSKDEFGYSLVTMEAAVMFVLNSYLNHESGDTSEDVSQDEKELEIEVDQTNLGENDVISGILQELEALNVSSDSGLSSPNSSVSGNCKSPLHDSVDENLGSFLSSLRKSQFVVCSGRQTD